MSDICIALCTCPDKQIAEKIAKEVVSKQLAACVNIIDQVTSIYRWDNKIVCDQEVQLVIKTCLKQVTPLHDAVAQLHPYEGPEWLVLENVGASNRYLDWMKSSLK